MADELDDDKVDQTDGGPGDPKAAKLYNSLISDGYTPKNLGSQDDFTNALSDSASADKIYSGLINDGYTSSNLGSKDDFMSTFVKKKESPVLNSGSDPFALPKGQEIDNSSTPTTQPSEFDGQNAIDLAKQSDQLSKQTTSLPDPDPNNPSGQITSPDQNAIAQAGKINDYLKKQKLDPKAINNLFGDMPDQAYQMTLPDGTQPQSKDELMKEYQQNPIDAASKINNIKTQFKIQNAAYQQQINNGADDHTASQYAIQTADAFAGLSAGVKSLPELYSNIQKKQQLINDNLTGDERDKALQGVQDNMSQFISSNQPLLINEYNQSPLKSVVSPDEYAGLQTWKLFNPAKYKQAIDILNQNITPTYTTSSNIPTGAMAGLGTGNLPATYETTDPTKGGTVSQTTVDKQIAQQTIRKQLLDTGRNNTLTKINADQYNIDNAYKNTQDPDEKNKLYNQYFNNQQIINGVKTDAQADDARFPLVAKLKLDDQVKDLMNDSGQGAFEYGANHFVHGFQNTANSAQDIVTGLFGSKSDNTDLQMTRIGEQQDWASQMHLPDGYKNTGADFVLKATPELQAQADAIIKGRSLSDLPESDINSLRSLISSNPSSIKSITNPNAGKSKNFFSKATLYSNAGFLGDVGSIVAQSAGLGAVGAGKVVSSMLPMFFTSYNDYFSEGSAQGMSPSIAAQYATTHASIMALAGAINPDLSIVRKAVGIGSPLGKIVAGIDEGTWDAIVGENKPLLNKFKNSVANLATESAKIASVYGVGTSIANDMADKGLFNKNISSSDMIDKAVQSTKDMMLGSAALMGLGAITNFKSASPNDKAALWELGDNPDIGMAKIDDAIQDGSITQEQGEQRKAVIKNVSSLIDNVPTENKRGKALSDDQRANYLYNLFIKNKANDLKKSLPDTQKEPIDNIKAQADAGNNKILGPDIIPTIPEIKPVVLQPKNSDNGIQVQSPGGILQREPAEDGSAGSERGQAEQGQQGQETATTPDTQEQAQPGEPQQSSDETSDSDTAQPGQKIKVLKKRAAPTIKSPLFKKALDNDSEDPRSQVMKYFVGGGRIGDGVIKEIYGNKQGKLNARISLRGKYKPDGRNTPYPTSVDDFADMLANNQSDAAKERYDTTDFKEAIHSVLQDHNARTSMAEELLHGNKLSTEDQQASDWYNTHYGNLPEDVSEENSNRAIDHMEGLSDDQIQHILDTEQGALNDEDYVKKLAAQHEEPVPEEKSNIVVHNGATEKDPAPKTNEQKQTEELISKAEEEVRVAKEAQSAKRKELDKGLSDDQQDLFGERKNKPALFDERADPKAREAALKPFNDRVTKAQAEVDRLNKVLDGYDGKPTAQTEIPLVTLNKSEIRVAKENIGNDEAQKIIDDEGLSLENLDDHKNLFEGFPFTEEDYNNVKQYLNDRKSTTAEPENAESESTGNDGNKEPGSTSEGVEGAKAGDTKGTEDDTAGDLQSKGETAGNEDTGAPVGKIAYARSNSYAAYKTIHPEESVDDYSKVRNSDVEIPTADLKGLGKEYAKEQSKKTFEQSVDDAVNKIIDKVTPKHMKGVKKAGIGTEDVIKFAGKIIKEAYHAKENIRDAVEKAIDYIKQHLNIDQDAEDKFRDHFNGLANDMEKARHLQKVTDMVADGKSDDQILMHLDRKGVPRENALAILGDAKTNQVSPEEKAEAIAAATKKYNVKEDDWMGEKALTLISSRLRAKEQQDAIKQSAGGTEELRQKIKDIFDGPGTQKEKATEAQKLVNTLHAAKNWTNIDRAIHIYLDLKRNPDHYDEYYPKLTPQQKAIADLSQNLNPVQLKIADDISKEYEELGKMLTDKGLLAEVIDNYVARAWDFGGRSDESGFKFTTNTRHTLERTLDTILQGQAEGLKLKTEGATNNLQILKTELGNVIENRKLIEQGFKTKVDTGLKDEDGNPITKSFFSVEPREGYSKIENPFFKKWTYIGKAGEGAEAHGQNIKIVGDSILEKKDIYAPKDVATSLNNILGKSKLGLEGYTKFTRAVKESILTASLFHYFAFTRAHILSGKFTELKGVNPVKAYKDGLKQLHALSPEVSELIKQGMTIGRQQDFTEGLSAHGDPKTQFGKMINQFHKHLFETYGAGLKTFDGVNLYRSELLKNAKRDIPLSRQEVATRVGKIMNDTYGGENFQRMRGSFLQNPTNRHIMSLALLAPDWTISNLRQAQGAFKGDAGKIYRNMWFRILTRGAAATLGANMLMTLMDDKDDDGNPLPYWEAFERRYSKAWDAGRMKAAMVDMTPLYRMAGGKPNERAYFSILGAYTDPVKLVNNPVQFLENKSSPTSVKIPLEVLTGVNWQQKRFTDVDELLGIDDKGTYSKTQTAHQKGNISPYTENAYKKNQKGYTKGDQKGGKLAGQLVKYDDTESGPVNYEQLPSFTLSQIRGMMPTALQSVYQGIDGENDWAKTMFQAPGTGVMFSKEGAQDKEKTLWNTGAKIVNAIKNKKDDE